MAEHLRTGAAGEQLACQWLETHGFKVLHRNWRYGHDEIDVVAREGRFLVVVEVVLEEALVVEVVLDK